MPNTARKYKPEHLEYVLENAGKLSAKEMADHIKVGVEAFKKQCYLWRLEGHTIKLKLGNASEGEIRIRTRGKNGYQEKLIKIGGKWMQLRRYNYEQKYGSIPAGYNVYPKDGDSLNCEPENLEARVKGSQMNGKASKVAMTTIRKVQKPKRVMTGTTSHKRKPGIEANWTQKHLVETKPMVIPPPPKGPGIRIDSRTTVFPRNANSSKEELTRKYSKNVDTIKENLGSFRSHAL